MAVKQLYTVRHKNATACVWLLLCHIITDFFYFSIVLIE